MAEQTVREQLVGALERLLSLSTTELHLALTECCTGRCQPGNCAQANARAALARHLDEPKTHHREDLLVALDEQFAGEYSHHHASDGAYDLWANALKAFKVAQSELSCPDICDTSCRCYQEGANEGHASGCNDDSCVCGECQACAKDTASACGCWDAGREVGYEAGLEAQRERVG